MSYKLSKILAVIIVVLLYATTILVASLMTYIGILGLIGLVVDFNIKDFIILSIVIIFFNYIYKTSWHIIKIKLQCIV